MWSEAYLTEERLRTYVVRSARVRAPRGNMTNLIALPNGTELVGEYRIERVLGAGGFGVTYLAKEIALERPVTIKEYFPSEFAARAGGNDAAPRSQDCAGDFRWGLERFIAEAQTLAKFHHTNIVQVHRYFRANNTAYMVMHFEEGQSLKGWLKALGRAPRQRELDVILEPLLDALELIHKAEFLHRDIAPDNIIIRKSGDPVLIDFGSARGEIGSHSKTISALVKPGYSPYEQYAETSKRQGPWTDIYALAATLYHAVTGKRPPDAPSRMVKDEIVPAREAALASYRRGFLKAIDKALKLNVDARPQSIAAWRSDLLTPDPPRTGWLKRSVEKKSEPEPAPKAAPEPAPQPAPAPVVEAKPEPAPAPPAKPPPAAPAAQTPPASDAPGPKGGMMEFLEALRKKRADAAGQPKAKSPAAAKQRIEVPPQPKKARAASKAKAKRDSADKLAPIPKGRALVEVRRQPKPRPVRGTRRRWVPIVFKLLVGVGVASAAVAMQDRFPRYESRGAAIPSSQSTGSTKQSAIVAPIAEFDAHRGPVTGLVYSADGRWIVTAGEDGTLKVWDATYNSLIRTIELDDGRATALAVLGSRALTGHADGKVVLWDLNRAEKLATVQRNEASVWDVVFTGDQSRFAVASHDWKIALWDATQPSAPLHVFEGHENSVQALAYDPNRAVLASGSADKTVRLWNLKTLSLKRRYRGSRDFLTAVVFSRDGKLLAGGSLDGQIQIWSALNSRRKRRLTDHNGRVTDLAFSPDGQYLASSSADGTVRLWDARRGRTVRALTGHTGGATEVAFSPDGQRLVSAGENGKVRVWSMPPAKLAKD